MSFPLSFWDISLWLALTSIVLLITSEFLSANYGKTRLLINRKRLRNTAFLTSIFFLVTIAVRIYTIITAQ